MKLQTKPPLVLLAVAALGLAPSVHALDLLAYYNFDGQTDGQFGSSPTATLGGSAALTTGNQGFSGAAGDESLDLGTVNNGAYA